MITGFNPLTTVTTPEKRADVYGCLGINGDANNPVGFIGDLIGRMDM